jgi:hypothetical protein
MSKTFAIVAAAAMLFGATAFAQDQSSPSSSPDTASSASAPADSGSADTGKKHRHHHAMSASNGGDRATDHDADKLNACMADAVPTAAQEQCLKQSKS